MIIWIKRRFTIVRQSLGREPCPGDPFLVIDKTDETLKKLRYCFASMKIGLSWKVFMGNCGINTYKVLTFVALNSGIINL